MANYMVSKEYWCRRDRDCMVVGFTTAYAISAYHYQRCEFESHPGDGLLNATLYDKACQ